MPAENLIWRRVLQWYAHQRTYGALTDCLKVKVEATGGYEQRQGQERGGLESDVRRDQGREDAKGPELEERAAVVHPPASIAYGRYGALLASLKAKDMVRREGDRAVLVR